MTDQMKAAYLDTGEQGERFCDLHAYDGLLHSSTDRASESEAVHCITKTYMYLYNFDPLKPHVYVVKLGFTGVYVIFLISAQYIGCGYSLEAPRRGGSNEYPQSMFLSRNMKNINFFI